MKMDSLARRKVQDRKNLVLHLEVSLNKSVLAKTEEDRAVARRLKRS